MVEKTDHYLAGVMAAVTVELKVGLKVTSLAVYSAGQKACEMDGETAGRLVAL